VRERHEARRNHLVLFIEEAARDEITERPPVGGGVARADLEHPAALELDVYDPVTADGRMAREHDWDSFYRTVVHAVDEIANPKSRDWTFT
jgi:hypothetical protein